MYLMNSLEKYFIGQKNPLWGGFKICITYYVFDTLFEKSMVSGRKIQFEVVRIYTVWRYERFVNTKYLKIWTVLKSMKCFKKHELFEKIIVLGRKSNLRWVQNIWETILAPGVSYCQSVYAHLSWTIFQERERKKKKRSTFIQRWIFLHKQGHLSLHYFFVLVQLYSNQGVSCRNIGQEQLRVI